MSAKSSENEKNQEVKIAEKVRQACVKAARNGFRDASIQGLCAEGASEAAGSAIQNLNLEEVIKQDISE